MKGGGRVGVSPGQVASAKPNACIEWEKRTITCFSLFLTPNEIMMRNILKKTRKTTLLANASGTMPRKVVAAPTMTEGPISPMASAMRASLGMFGSCDSLDNIKQNKIKMIKLKSS